MGSFSGVSWSSRNTDDHTLTVNQECLVDADYVVKLIICHLT